MPVTAMGAGLRLMTTGESPASEAALPVSAP